MLPNRIADYRKVRGWSQTVLAEQIGTTRNMMQKLESGERDLKTDWLERIGQALEIEPYLLIAPERVIPNADELTEMLALAQRQIPAGLPYSEWPKAVAAMLHIQLRTIAGDRAS